MASALTRKVSHARRQLTRNLFVEIAEFWLKRFATGPFTLRGSRFSLSLNDATLGQYTLDKGHVTGVIELNRIPPERVELNNCHG